MTLPFPTLQFLSGVTDAHEFLSRFWERAPVHLGSDRGPALFAFDFLDAIRQAASTRAVELIGRGKEGGTPTGPGDPEWPRVTGGRSARVVAVHRFAPALDEFRERLERELSHSVVINLYVSSPRSRGLDIHCDGHSVFIFQVAGSKRWRVWPRDTVPLDHRPLVGFETYRQRPKDYRGTVVGGRPMDMDNQSPEIDLRLETGSVLYVPRGMPHEVWTEDDFSAHLTIGIHLTTWADVAIAAVADAELDPQSPLRQAIPVGSFRTLPPPASLPQTLSPWLGAVAERPAHEALQALAVRWLNRGQPPAAPSTPAKGTAIEWLTRPQPLCFVEAADVCTLAGFRTPTDAVSLPLPFREALRFVAVVEPPTFSIDQIPGLTRLSRQRFCADLLERGFLVEGRPQPEAPPARLG